MNFGTIQVADIFVGALNATEAYFGTEKVWESTPSTEGWTKVKYTAASGLPDWEGDIVGEITGGSYGAATSQIPKVKEAQQVEIGTHVTGIKNDAFRGAKITSLTIPDSVTSIGDYGCRGMAYLQSVTLPDTLTKIGDQAFQGSTVLSSITIPNGVTQFGNSAFSGSGLMSIYIPSSVTNIGNYTFDSCTNLSSITVDVDNPNYKSDNGLLLNKDGTKVIAGVNGDVVVPNGVTTIGYAAFRGRTNLTSVTIPDSVTSIEKYAFNNCSSLSSVTMTGKDISTVQSMSNYSWSLKTGCVIHCSDGDITL